MKSETPNAPAPLHTIPTAERPPHGHFLSGVLFVLLFNLGIILTNLVQLIFFPLALVPATRPAYQRVLDFTKGTFGQLTVFISQRFAPTKFIVSAGEGMSVGEEWVERDGRGRVRGVRLPDQGVWMANHQTLADWLYIWSFTYLATKHTSILITLKSSLKWLPFVGWACQLYGFVFLARNWATDKVPFKMQLERVSERLRSSCGEDKLALLIFPEGTLVTGNTRPKSLAHAEKLGIPDLKHTLLPRSTGLFFTLRTLAHTLPSLSLIDLTLGYPGISPSHYPEDHYNLSIWFKNVPPPSIHFHLRTWVVRTDVPIGDWESGVEGTEEERAVFDEWLRARWGEKDQLMERFAKEGSFGGRSVEWPVELRSAQENLAAFSYFFPIVFGWFVLPSLVGAVGGVVRAVVPGWGRAVVEEPIQKACGCAKMVAERAAKKALGEL